MNRWIFAINGYDILFLATISIGLLFAVLLFFVKRINRRANRFLSMSLLVVILWMCWVLAIDVHADRYFRQWSWLPLQFSLVIGPFIYYYVQTLLHPGRKLVVKDLIHFCPLLIEQGVLIVEVFQSAKTGAPTYNTRAFTILNPIIQLLALVSVITYLYLSSMLIQNYHRKLADQFSDADRYQYFWLKRLLTGFAVLWMLWAPFTVADFLYFNYRLGISSYYPLYLLLATMIVWIGAEAFLRPEFVMIETAPIKPATGPQPPSAEILRLADWLEKQMSSNLFYQNASLTLRQLAEELTIHPNELSRIINAGTGKNFNDFVNTYRINEVKQKINDPAFNHITILGIAFDSGFNSKTTFNRTFREFTGQSPAEYKASLKNIKKN